MRIRFVVPPAVVGCLALFLGLGPGRTQNPAVPPASREQAKKAQPPASKTSQAPKAPASTSWVDERFKRLDRNGDGFLTDDEMTENLKAEKNKWDVNRDGMIDLDEWRAYVKAFNAHRRSSIDQRKVSRGPARKPRTRAAARKPRAQRGTRPPFDEGRLAKAMGQRTKGSSSPKYLAQLLPNNVPAWFREYDTDRDGQVSFREWKERGDDVGEFRRYDLNGDGFITLEELIVSGQFITAKGEVPPPTVNVFQAEPGTVFYFERTGTTGEPIWGTGVYTINSKLATTAVHAGVLRAGQTGLVKVTILAGQAKYRGTTGNGVTSQDSGPFHKSYRVEKAP
jgi:Ca2+-binding EF-hand superfamily protein